MKHEALLERITLIDTTTVSFLSAVYECKIYTHVPPTIKPHEWRRGLRMVARYVLSEDTYVDVGRRFGRNGFEALSGSGVRKRVHDIVTHLWEQSPDNIQSQYPLQEVLAGLFKRRSFP